MLLKFITTLFNCYRAPLLPYKKSVIDYRVQRPFSRLRRGETEGSKVNYSLNTDVRPYAHNIDWTARCVIGRIGDPLVVQGNKQLFIGFDAVIGL